jgi:hypothetical protein
VPLKKGLEIVVALFNYGLPDYKEPSVDVQTQEREVSQQEPLHIACLGESTGFTNGQSDPFR